MTTSGSSAHYDEGARLTKFLDLHPRVHTDRELNGQAGEDTEEQDRSDRELRALIERRDYSFEDALDAAERRRARRRRAENRREWYVYHASQAERLRRTMEPLIAFHEARAQRLLAEGAVW